jgi:outer membrane autotransporter protein
LGEIRRAPGSPAPQQDNGELFVRYIGGDYTRKTDLSFKDFGFDYDQRIDAMQVGSSWVGHFEGDNTLRLGGALTTGTSDISPDAVDGHSSIDVDALTLSAMATYEHASGWYVDNVLSFSRYNAEVKTNHGTEAKPDAHAWSVSVETGYPFDLGRGLQLEPQAQIFYQQLEMETYTDDDGVTVKGDAYNQVSGRLGARLSQTLFDDRQGRRVTPYLKANYLMGSSHNPTVTMAAGGAEDSFRTASAGNSWEVGLGVTGTLSKDLAVYGEASHLEPHNGEGVRGEALSLGVRWSF